MPCRGAERCGQERIGQGAGQRRTDHARAEAEHVQIVVLDCLSRAIGETAPLITIGQGSYMNELVEIAGATNIYGDMKDVSPTVSIEDVLKRDPDYIITGPEGATKIGEDPKWAASRAVKNKGLIAADTSLVGRPSVRLGEAALSLAKLFHPGRIR